MYFFMHFHIISLFPKAFDSYLGESIVARAIKNKLVGFSFYDIRVFSKDKFRRVDGRPYGGGPGMVMQVDPILRATRKALTKAKKGKVKILIFSPGGKQFTNEYAAKLVKSYQHLVLISGRYEGIDARVKKILKAEEVSVGPYVLTGGELPAMIVADAVTRRIPGVLGNESSIEEERVASTEIYTRPEVYIDGKKKYRVPKVLLSGNHKDIDAWKERTNKRK
jgi:tRNA (guanine37-N1)-methyltransferase